MTAMIFLYVIMGTVAGYYSSRLYRTIRGKEWKKQAFLVSKYKMMLNLQIMSSTEAYLSSRC